MKECCLDQNREDDIAEKLKTRIAGYNGVKDILVNYYGDKVVPSMLMLESKVLKHKSIKVSKKI